MTQEGVTEQVVYVVACRECKEPVYTHQDRLVVNSIPTHLECFITKLTNKLREGF